MSDEKLKIKPSRAWYVVAGIMFVLFGFCGTPFLILGIIQATSGGEQFMVPGAHSTRITAPGKYVIWDCYSVLYNGRQYNSEPSLPDGTTIQVFREGPGSEPVTVPTSPTAMRVTEGPNEAVTSYAICTFVAEQEGTYTIEVQGLPSPRVFKVRKAILGHVLTYLALDFLATLVGWIGAPAIAIVVAVKRAKARRALNPS